MSVIRRIIKSTNTYAPVGPYSQAVQVDKTLYVSGCLGLDRDTMKLVNGGAASQTRKALNNLGAVLNTAGSSYENVVKVTIMLKSIDSFPDVNSVYKEFFLKNFPARSTYEVGKLPLDAEVEIEAIAIVGPVQTISD